MLWIPGPTEVRPEILSELAQAMIGHRSKAMTEILERIDPPLRLAFGLAKDSPSVVAVGTHSATGMMEGALLGVGDRVLAVVNGAFAKRWAEIGKQIGKQVTTLDLPLGQAATQETLGRILAEQGPFDAVTLVVNETSTGVRTPLAPVADVLAAHPHTLLLVDVVSALAGYPVDFDRHKIDFALAGVNKALALPPGITVMAASARYLESARARERRGWYLDPVRTIEGHLERKTPVTPCISLCRALAKQLEDITNGVTLPRQDRGKTGEAAWAARYAKHERMQRQAFAWAAEHGIELFPPKEFCSPTVTCFKAGSIDVALLIDQLKKRGHEIGNGYGSLKGQTFRIGHMGDHTEEGLADLLAKASSILGARARA